MLSGKFLFTLIGLIAAVFAICQLNFGQDTVEGWWNGQSRKWKAMPVIKNKGTCGMVAAGGNFLGPLGDDRFIKNPNLQGLLSPRFANVDMGANILYNSTDYINQATPCTPLTFGDMAEENYQHPSQENYPTSCGSGSCGGGCSPSCGKSGMPVPYSGGAPATDAGYAGGNFNQVLEQVYDQSSYPDAVNSLPIGTMTTIDALGNVTEPVVYNTFMFANQQSRLRAQGDPIRGDLPIVPCEGNWFSVHPNVNLDLQEGAMNVLGGVSNQTASALSQLIHTASGNTQTAIGGVNLADVNMSAQYSGHYSGIQNDVMISGMA